MNVLCPISPATGPYIEQLAAAGADEFYLGYTSGFSDSSMILSRRPGTKKNFPSMPAAGAVAASIKSHGLKTHLAVNSVYYPPQYMADILSDLDTAVEIGFDGFIMADFNLFLEFRKRHPGAYVTASTCMHAMNSRAVEFLGRLGFLRVVLPRHLSIQETITIASTHPGLDFEIIAKNDECPNIDGLCSYFHGVIEGSRMDPDSEKTDTACKLISLPDRNVMSMLKMNYHACGLCDISALGALPNISLKISGRNLSFDSLVKDVTFVSSAVKRLGQDWAAQEFTSDCMELHRRIYGRECGRKCYRTAINSHHD